MLINMACIGLVMSIKLYGDEDEDELLPEQQGPTLMQRIWSLVKKENSTM